MVNPRTHFVTTADGVTIGATVHGQGPPLVFLQGAVGDGDLDWKRVVEHLSGRFTCHLPSIRGRGLSGDHPDLGPRTLVADFAAYVDSIGEPVGLVGWSGGGYCALGVAASRPQAVAGVAPWEPGILSLLDDAGKAVVGSAIARAAQLAAGGDLTAALRAFLAFPFHDDEIAAAERAGYVEAAAGYFPKLLSLIQQGMADPLEGAVEDPSVLATISAPVLLLLGSDTKPFYTTSARHVVDHAPRAEIRTIPGAAHAAPLTHPGALAAAVTEFFGRARSPT